MPSKKRNSVFSIPTRASVQQATMLTEVGHVRRQSGGRPMRAGVSWESSYAHPRYTSTTGASPPLPTQDGQAHVWVWRLQTAAMTTRYVSPCGQNPLQSTGLPHVLIVPRALQSRTIHDDRCHKGYAMHVGYLTYRDTSSMGKHAVRALDYSL